MSKSIYEEVIKVVRYLQKQDSHLKDTTGTIYIPSEDITTLENLLIYSQKQEKLLELYRYLNGNTISYDLSYDDEDEITSKIDEIEKQIRELEKLFRKDNNNE